MSCYTIKIYEYIPLGIKHSIKGKFIHVVTDTTAKYFGNNMKAQVLSKKVRNNLKLLWKKANDLNDPEAQFRIGLMYARRNKIVLNSKKSLHWCEKAAAQGDRKCLCDLGYIYYKVTL